MQILVTLKNALIGYCIGFTAASYVCALTGWQMVELRHSFFGFVCFCISWLLIDAMKISNKQSKYDGKTAN